MLTIRGLWAGYGRRDVLRDVGIEVDPGRLVAVLGANGAGKTTLMNAVAGLSRVSRGSVLVDDVDVTHVAAHKRVAHGLCLVPEGRHLFPAMSVLDNLMLADRSSARTATAMTLQEVYDIYPVLRERQHVPAGNLSGGEQQMVAIARALLIGPRYLLLDEPSTGLAPRLVRDVIETARELANKGIGVLLVEQNAHEVMRVADFAYVLEHGVITGRGAVADLMKDEALRRSYLGG
ncbi:ABC transporter ATP-binding protein [Nocardioides terrisoli]|uniref:ABC transporter ATP-binding protein n=1 Tax=Nocardioides terrisoli TaxID=3388267 RepID=UPI00287B9FDC|nr:ABC transporter ATP-binding protein [Nocardioides marmorisolisilvae]